MMHELLNINEINVIETHPFPTNVSSSFAIDDMLCLSADESSETSIRFWTHSPTIVYGIPDSRLPFFNEGVEWVRQAGFDVVIRNSGGLAVLLDEGILNISLIFPDSKDIHKGYQAMVSLIQNVFQSVTNQIKAYEIVNSYCPGDYDLSIDGKKFAGISQRRIKNASAVQIYLCVEGDGHKRAEWLKQFYDIAKKDVETPFTYPNIDPNVMASLEQLLNQRITVQEVITLVIRTLKEHGIKVTDKTFNNQEKLWFNERYNLMKSRNKSVNSL